MSMRRRTMEGKSAWMNNGQQFIRQVNNIIYELLVKLGIEDGEFWCECDDVHCDERVKLTLREFAALEKGGGVLRSRTHAAARQPAR
jgi:hypothetical protein